MINEKTSDKIDIKNTDEVLLNLYSSNLEKVYKPVKSVKYMEDINIVRIIYDPAITDLLPKSKIYVVFSSKVSVQLTFRVFK